MDAVGFLPHRQLPSVTTSKPGEAQDLAYQGTVNIPEIEVLYQRVTPSIQEPDIQAPQLNLELRSTQGTTTQPQCNRKFRQFKKDQYCTKTGVAQYQTDQGTVNLPEIEVLYQRVPPPTPEPETKAPHLNSEPGSSSDYHVAIASTNKEKRSVHLNEILNTGYSVEERRSRVAAYRWCMAQFNKLSDKYDPDVFIVGSKSEGMTMSLDGDTDLLAVNKKSSVVEREGSENIDPCLDSQPPEIRRALTSDEFPILLLVKEDAPAGYWYLRRIADNGEKKYYHHMHIVSDVQEAFYTSYGAPYGRFFRWLYGYNFDRQGPSNAIYISSLKSVMPYLPIFKYVSDSYDFVEVIQCALSGSKYDWCDRERSGDWPSSAMIEHVLSLPVHLAPVGQKDHPRYDHQWRASFTLAENYLVQNFTDGQAKVYHCLRTFAKKMLKEKCENITSYVMKNVMFWYCETCPTEKFLAHNLLDRLEEALDLLESKIKENNMPHYFLPERNLFELRMDAASKTNVLDTLRDIKPNIAKYTLRLAKNHRLELYETYGFDTFAVGASNGNTFFQDSLLLFDIDSSKPFLLKVALYTSAILRVCCGLFLGTLDLDPINLIYNLMLSPPGFVFALFSAVCLEFFL